MDVEKRKRLEAAGFRIGSVVDFLELTPEESNLVDLRLALSARLRRHRLERGYSQTELAQKIRSSQSRVAKMEAGDMSVSLDLLIRALLAAGVTRQELAEAIAA